MSLGLSVTAFAAQGDVVPSGSLTVTGDQLAGKNVTAIRMFTARATQGSDTANESYVFDSYELEDAWLNFFKTSIGKDTLDDVSGVVFSASPTDDEYKEAAIKYVASLTNDDQDKGTLADFAEKAQDWAVDTAHKSSFADLTTTQTASQVGDTTTGSAIFKGLTTGYYLVFPEGGGTGNSNRATDAMLINIPTNKEDTTWNIKSTYPTVEKKVDDRNTATGSGNADNGSAQVGDVVTFTLTSAVPDTSDYETYVFQFTDKLPAGLTLVDYKEENVENRFSNDDVTLKVNNKNVVNSKFDVSAVAITGENYEKYASQGITAGDIGKTLLTVTITNLKDADLLGDSQAATAGQPIVLTYKAMINENAVSTDPVTNEASVQYSNDPNNATLGTSTPDESKVYTYQIGVHKYTGDWNNGSAPCLPGAKFVLSKKDTLTGTSPNYSGDEGVIKLAGSGNEYRVATADDVENTTYEFTTNATGEIVIKGLEAGTYYLHEVAAPNGYNKLKEPIKITISVSDGNASLEAPVYTIGSTANTANDDTVGVQNKKGIELPETGSIGTIGLTIAGVAIVLIGVFAPRKKKNNQE